MKLWRFSAVLALAAVLSACQFFGPSTAEMTLAVENQVLSTEIAALRATATVEADRMLVTLEHAQTAVSHVNGQTGALQATLMANGQPADLSNITPQALMTPTPPPPILDIGPQAPAVAPIGITPGATIGPSGANPDNSPALVITPIVADTAAPLSNIVMSEAVGSDDCAIQPTTSFTTQTPQIYVVALARGIGPQDRITSRWSRDGQAVVDYSWSPNFNIEEACIWFYIDQSEIEFTPGNWQVQMELNGQPIGSPATFRIDAVGATGDQMLEETFGQGG